MCDFVLTKKPGPTSNGLNDGSGSSENESQKNNPEDDGEDNEESDDGDD